MRQHPLIVGLRDRLGGRMEFTDSENETPQDGRFKAVFTATGFSLRVRRRDDENGPVALISVRDGEFSSFQLGPSSPVAFQIIRPHSKTICRWSSVLDVMWKWTEIMQSPSFVSVATLPPCLPSWTISPPAYRPSPTGRARSRDGSRRNLRQSLSNSGPGANRGDSAARL